MPINGETPLKMFLLWNKRAMTLKLVIQHLGLGSYSSYTNKDSGLTLTFSIARSCIFYRIQERFMKLADTRTDIKSQISYENWPDWVALTQLCDRSILVDLFYI